MPEAEITHCDARSPSSEQAGGEVQVAEDKLREIGGRLGMGVAGETGATAGRGREGERASREQGSPQAERPRARERKCEAGAAGNYVAGWCS